MQVDCYLHTFKFLFRPVFSACIISDRWLLSKSSAVMISIRQLSSQMIFHKIYVHFLQAWKVQKNNAAMKVGIS